MNLFFARKGSKHFLLLFCMEITAWRYSDDVMTSYHRKCVQILSEGKSLIFGQIRLRTVELAALERLENSP